MDPLIYVQYVECIGHVNEWHGVINQSIKVMVQVFGLWKG